VPSEQKGLDFGGTAPGPGRRRALTVSQLTDRVQGVLQTDFFDVWVEGEVRDVRPLPSGMVYFMLRDANAQLRCVVFKQQARLLRFKPAEGAKVVARGSLRVFPPKGEYSLSVDALEPLGKGGMQQAFEDLKQKLEKDGLFEKARKRALPALPRRIGVVTSPGGAVLQDILRVLGRRYPNLDVLVYPARVQGPEAAAEIEQGIRALNALPLSVDVLVVARGGGSLEDLWPFNEERVARALAASRIPTISAVGHETDFTIADFVADHRAPTPSAAAELVVKAKEDIEARLQSLERRVDSAVRLRLGRARSRLATLAAERVLQVEQARVRALATRVEQLERRAAAGLAARVDRTRTRVAAVGAPRLQAALRRGTERGRARHRAAAERLARLNLLQAPRAALSREAARLAGLSPLAVLSRGYAVAFDEAGHVVQRAGQVSPGDTVRVRLHEGTITTTVTGREDT
jgi:exodeoxyribonuclease VII large subunit